MQQHTLGEKLLRSGGNITMVVDNLEKRDLILRERSTEDRRCIWVRLTRRGRALIRRVFPRIAARIRDQLDVLTATELKTFSALCRRIGLHESPN